MYGETEDTNLAKQNRASFNNKQIPTTFAVKSKKKTSQAFSALYAKEFQGILLPINSHLLLHQKRS